MSTTTARPSPVGTGPGTTAARPDVLTLDDALADPAGYRVLTGDRPTGPLHVGHLLGTLVPVGRDQLPLLELTRTIARRFNRRYGRTFDEPSALLSDAPLVLGTDGRKMSKSAGNTIDLRASADATAAALRGARTDGERTITYEPERRPEVANLLLLGALATGRTPQDLAEEIGDGCAAAIKRYTTDALVAHLAPLRARRAELARDRFLVPDVLARGAVRATELADATLALVRTAMRQTY